MCSILRDLLIMGILGGKGIVQLFRGPVRENVYYRSSETFHKKNTV